jgi:LSU ribosomal protein L20P
MRVKRAVHARKRKKSLFKAAKGYRGGRSRLLRTVKDAVDRSRESSYRDRKVKKRDFRRLWIVRINAAPVRLHGMNYSQFIYGLKAADIEMDRRTLAYLAMEEPTLFAQVAEEDKNKTSSIIC